MKEAAPGRRPTIRDVARLAGVSHQTVSRFLREDAAVKERSRERIADAIAQLDYRPNLVARAMRDRSTRRIALIVPAGTAVSSLFVLSGANSEAHLHGYTIEVVTLDGAARQGSRAMELADSGLFEGILSLTPLPPATGRRRSRVPVVEVPIYDGQMRGTGVLADATRIGEVIESLAEQGHRTFLHVAGDYAHSSARSRRDIFLETIRRLGLRSEGVIDSAWDPEAARRAVRDLPADTEVTAVIAANDVLAVGAIRGALERGWNVPADLSVTGWENEPIAAAMAPSLSTVEVEHRGLGVAVVRHMLAILHGEVPESPPGVLTTIIWRESTGPAPHR